MWGMGGGRKRTLRQVKGTGQKRETWELASREQNSFIFRLGSYVVVSGRLGPEVRMGVGVQGGFTVHFLPKLCLC